MTTEKENIDIFGAKLVDTIEVNGVIFQLFSNRILHVRVPKFQKIGIELIGIGYAFVEKNGGGKFYNIYQFDSFSDVDPEIRKWAADSEGNLNTHTDAIVIGSLPQKIITDFYLKIDKPVAPTKVFYSLRRAIEWTKIMMRKVN